MSVVARDRVQGRAVAGDLAAIRLPLRIRPVSDEAVRIEDAAGICLASFYFDDGCPVRRSASRRQTKEQAIEVARVTARSIEARVRAEAQSDQPKDRVDTPGGSPR